MRILLKKRYKLLLLLIITLAIIMRFYGINWDNHCCMHPDERAIILATIPLTLPQSFTDFLSPQSPLNPHFFAYGNFPLYLLKVTATLLSYFDSSYLNYEKINLVGRALSSFADIGTIILIFLLAKKLYNQTAGVIASFFYSVSVLPIQASHYYAVDVLFTFFITLTLYQIARYYENASIKNAILLGVIFGFSLSTKISSIPLIASIVLVLVLDFILILIMHLNKPRIWYPHIPKFLKQFIFKILIISFSVTLTFTILQPYAIIDFQEFSQQMNQMSQVMNNPYAFPFTLQYVGKIPYLYELRNIFLWGQGPIISIYAFLGSIYVGFRIFYTFSRLKLNNKKGNLLNVDIKKKEEIIIFVFFLIYFFVIGKFAVGFMRYMLPLYPLLSIFAGIFIFELCITLRKKIKNNTVNYILYLSVVILCLIWPLSFIQIYSNTNTRIIASEWINSHILPGKVIAIEHWDDAIPVFGGNNYPQEILPLYDPDTTEKWSMINSQIAKSDYIIIASNRLYVPLQKLTDCQKLPPGRCYKITSKYYDDLFSERLGFKKVAEFAEYPTIPFLNIKIDDQGADESFTVYDHPKIMIFKRD